MAAPAFPSKAQLEAELAAEQQQQAAAAAAHAHYDAPHGALRRPSSSSSPTSASPDRQDNGPSELTLIAYSAFMGLSSLIFGGLTLLQARNSNDAEGGEGASGKPLSFPEMLLQGASLTFSRLFKRIAAAFLIVFSIDTKDLVTGLLILVIVLVVAYWTKPSDASFRNYLTDLSLHQHLRHIQDQQKGGSAAAKTSVARQPASAASEQALPSDRTSPHVLTFANRISISLRTPPYVRHDYALFSIVMVSHPPSPCAPGLTYPASRQAKSACSTCNTPDAAVHRPRNSWYVGVFGRWWHGASEITDLQQTNSNRSGDMGKRGGKKGFDRSAAVGKGVEYGVLEMKTGDADQRQASRDDGGAQDDASPHGQQSATVAAKAAKRKTKNSLRLRASQNTAPPTAAARSTAIAAQRNMTDDLPSPQRAQSDTNQPPRAAEGAASNAAESKDATALQSDIEELRAQLASLKGSTDSTQAQLQARLEELRTRKKDDDAARADLKGKMKTLDEGKRSAEAAKRDAEKRLKAAQQVREGLQKRADASRAALTSFQEREKASAERLSKALSGGAERRAEIERELAEKQQSILDAEKALAEVKDKVEQCEKVVLEEQEKVQAAETSLQARMKAKAQRAAAAAQAAYQAQHQQAQQAQQQQHLMQLAHADQVAGGAYGSQYGFGEDDQAWPRGEENEGLYQPFAPLAGRRASEDQFGRSATGFYPFGSSAADAYVPGFQYQQHGLDQHSSPFGTDNAPLPPSHGAYHTPRHPRSMADLSTRYAEDSSTPYQPKHAGFPPVSPFSTDLLPSNLFQSIEDEAGHPAGTRSRSDTIEAAMGRFGLVDSDTSDAEGQGPAEGGEQSDRETVDGVLDGDLLHPLSEHESEDEVATAAGREAASQRARVKPARSWWGSTNRANRQANAGAGEDADPEDDDDHDESTGAASGKRKSFGMFPRLLNPGARAFRSASRKQADADALRGLQPNGFGSEGYLGPPGARAGVEGGSAAAGGAGAGQGSTPFDAVLRAFEASNPPDEEEGRRSWSAFDQWSQRQGLPSRLAGPGHERTPSGGLSAANANASPIIPSGLGQEPFNGWSEDLFQPLGRTTSAGASIGSSAQSQPDLAATASASPATSRNRSRFAFWSQNSKGSLNSLSSGASASGNGGGAGGNERGASRERLSTSASSSSSTNANNRLLATSPPGVDAPTTPGQEDVFGSLGADSTSEAAAASQQLGTSPASIVSSSSRPGAEPGSAKRRSFRWPKRQNSSSTAVGKVGKEASSAAGDDVAEE